MVVTRICENIKTTELHNWASKHGGWLPPKGKCGSCQALLRFRPGTDSVIPPCSVKAGHGSAQIQGEGADNTVISEIHGSLRPIEVIIYHNRLSVP